MLIKLTNAVENFRDRPLYINPSVVSAVYPDVLEGETVTFIFGGPTGVTWQVTETVEEVVNLLNSAEKRLTH